MQLLDLREDPDVGRRRGPATFRVVAGESELVGSEPEVGGRFTVVRVSCLDGVTDEELARAPVTYFDGRHDDYRHPPAETRHL